MYQKTTLLACLLLLISAPAWSFCGFFVAKADAKLFNESSQVILVRDGNKTVITMSNDFKGDVKDFAMVVPVPQVLQRSDIKVVNQLIFDQIDQYSAPRLAEYFDKNPCMTEARYNYLRRKGRESMATMGQRAPTDAGSRYEGVKIEATYTVGEYDIMILSAEESGGLKNFLTDNGYTIPENAHEVLDPYVKSDMKFFLAKVSIDAQQAGFTTLNPLQMTFTTEKFMLPIRLGMANADKAQDLMIYTFTRKGRVEATNYRTLELPSNNPVPEFVNTQFGDFYKAVFDRCYEREGQNAVFVEYAWDLASNVKCDPCVSPPPPIASMNEAGVWWNGGRTFFTRLHVRYDREHFPQDLQFQITPNSNRFQVRYVMRHPAYGTIDCAKGQDYYKALVTRRRTELAEYEKLTGWSTEAYGEYVDKYARRINGGMPDEGGNSSTYDFDGGDMSWPDDFEGQAEYYQADRTSKATIASGNSQFWLYVLLATAGVLLYMEVLRRFPLRKQK